MMGMRILVEEALRLKKEGVSANEIVDHIEKTKTKIRTAGIVDTLEYLYKGGRLSKTAAVLGNVLGIKPVLKLENGVISMVDKARGTGNAIKLLMQYLDKNPIDFDKKVYFGYTGDPKRLDKLTKEFCHKYKNYSLNKKEYKIISGVIGTHLGPGVCMIIYLTK